MRRFFNISNALSFFRLLLAIPLWFLLDDLENSGTKLIILIVAFTAIVSDFLDGYFARKLNQITETGKIIDPLADKVITAAVVIKLFLIGQLPATLFYMIIGRDILIFLGGIILSAKLGKVLPSNMLGKITVTVLALLLLLIILNFDRTSLIFKSIYLSALGLIIASFIGYIIRASEFIRQRRYESVQ
jgi:CDP-diacylglycerol--glycerol-3-phosphate 3-phosphatidyltransferase